MFPIMSIYPMMPNIIKLGTANSEPPTIYALLNSYVNFSKEVPTKIADLAKTGRAMFFDFDYPLASGINKEDFETMILNHFLMRRIGYETVTAFKIALNVKLNEIMPLYNKLFESIANWNLFADGETVNRIATDNKLSSNVINDDTVNTTSSTTANNQTSDRRSSDTPQNAISDVRDGKYVSNYEYDQESGSVNNIGNSTSNNDVTNNLTETNTKSETISRTNNDKISIYSEFLKNRQNIYTMIFKDLDSLFYQII